MNGIPFSNNCTASDPAVNNRHRLKQYRKFMGVGTLRHCMSLDIGRPNYISEELDVFDNTHFDLNQRIVLWGYENEVVTCFEVIQHVMNPLSLLEGIHLNMKEGGKLYLSTPKQWLIPWYHGQENFVEYKPKNMRKMLEHAGFKVVRIETHNPWPFRFIFYGIRPIFRYIFNRYVIFECVKQKG